MKNIMKPYKQPAFLICAGLLVLAAAAMQRMHVEKVPLPLKKSLDLLDENGLGQYRVISKNMIANEDVIKTLGTEQYIQWILEDTSEAADSTVSKCSLFITYYELPDNVPHIPEECYVGGGHDRLESSGLTVEIGTADTNQTIPGRRIVFEHTNPGYRDINSKFSVFYLISVKGHSCGDYAGGRQAARWLLNKNIFSKRVYFCKVEWNFLNNSGRRTHPQKDKAVAASERLLGVILPILEKEHWPDPSQ